ncbi:MAG: hypothetical protein ACLRWP_00400 [Bilophila wadsworthia]
MSEQPHDTEPVTIVLATRNQGKVRELAEPLRLRPARRRTGRLPRSSRSGGNGHHF